MKLEKIQASTPNIFNIINNVSQDSTNFEDLLLNLFNNEVTQINTNTEKNMLTDKIKELLNLNNKDNFIINDLIQDNINLLFNNKIETQKNNEISTNLNLNILEKDLTNILQNELNVEKDNDLKSNLNDSNLQQELIDLFCFFYHYINNNQNNLINSQTIDTDNITDNKSQLNINLNDIVNFNYFKILSNHFINNQTIQNIYDNNKYQINKENQQQINNNFIDLNKVKQFISDIIKTFETNHLEQELNVIIPRYSFKIDSKNILNQNTFDELEKNVDILKNFQKKPSKVDNISDIDINFINKNSFSSVEKFENKNLMKTNDYYKVENINEILNIVSTKIKNIKNEDIYELKIYLKPRELGEINIKVTYNNGNVNGIIIANNKEVANLLKENINYLKEQIINNNYEYKEINLNVQTDSERDSNNYNKNRDQKQKKKNNNTDFIIQQDE